MKLSSNLSLECKSGERAEDEEEEIKIENSGAKQGYITENIKLDRPFLLIFLRFKWRRAESVHCLICDEFQG